MTSRAGLPPLETLRDAIADALWGAVGAGELPATCVRLGLHEGTTEEAFKSKRKYVRARLVNHKGPELLALSKALLEEYEAPSLEDFISELTTHAENRVTDLTRRAVLTATNEVGNLFGDLPILDGLGALMPDWQKASAYSNRFDATIRDDIEQHYIRNSDLLNSDVLELCGALACAQQCFFDVLELLVHPGSRRGKEQADLVEVLNGLLGRDGFMLAFAGSVSRHPRFEVRRIAAGVAGAPKNLIFAAINVKPDLYFTDAINNDVAIANDSDALVYDRLLLDAGLTWHAMAEWWAHRCQTKDIAAAGRRLFVRLREAVRATTSPGENAIFETYYAHFAPKHSDKLPALVPQVYLHYDPRSSRERGAHKILLRQRMDFLLLLDHGLRIVIEVDGSQHYSEAGQTSPSKYATMVAEDRRLRLAGYEVYRFGGAEFSDVTLTAGRYVVGATTRENMISFFDRLFARHSLKP